MRVGLCCCLLAAFAAVVGCSHHRRGGSPAASTSRPLEAILPTARAHGLAFDDRQVGTLSEVDEALRPLARQPAEYRALSPEQCQCLAVKASSEGNSLASERRALTATASPHGLSDDERLKIQVVWASELEARNHSAADALTAYYHLAQAEANQPLLARSLEELDEALANVARLRRHGMQLPFDDGELKRQRLAMIDKQLKSTSDIDRLNAQLVQLLGLNTQEVRPRLWPTADLTVVVAPIDIDLAVAVGVAARPELKLLLTMRRSLKAKNVAITRDVVGGAGALIGSQGKFTGLVSLLAVGEFLGQRRANRLELPTRQRQLADYYDRRRREVTAQIQQAVLEVESSLRRTAVAKGTVLAWRAQIDELGEKSRIDEATFLDMTRARLHRLEAESDEIEQVIAWKVAQAKVKEAQGMLVAECQGNRCNFLDHPVIHDTSAEPATEFATHDEMMPDAPQAEADADADEQPHDEAIVPGLTKLGVAIPVRPPAPPPPPGDALPGRRLAAEPDLPDMALEPPTASDAVTNE